jgi:predicted transposase YbfD/YdcC
MSQGAPTAQVNEASPFHFLIVRPITANERSAWDTLMATHHYLGFRSLVGESIRYVAEMQGRWVALLGWCAAALKCRARDTWIGWPQVIQWQRLHLIANNARFLILPDIHIPNLASRILSLNLKRLARDWEQIHGHPVLLAETFVDSSRFAGTCYKAANWVYLGQTRGFGKLSHSYFHHGQKKALFVRPLNKKALRWLTDPVAHPQLVRKVTPMKFTKKQIDDLINSLKGLPEPRHKRGLRHRKISILAIAICAVVCGARSYTAIAEWAQRCSQKMLQRLWCRFDEKTQRYVPPSEPTIRRLVHSIDAEAVDQSLGGWVGGLFTGEAIGFDGKVLKGARREDGSKVHLLSAFVHQEGITIAQRQISSKSNEIPAAQPLLEPLDLKGQVVTADAMHTQTELARFLVEEKRADYCFTVKDNQPTLKEDIASLHLNEEFPPEHETIEKGHGRLEIRRIWTSTEINDYVRFPYCGQVACLERYSENLKSGKTRRETVYLITSLSPEKATAERVLNVNRGQWGIENRIYYVRDVTFDEDRSQVRTKCGPRMMAILRNFAISILRLTGVKNIAKALRTMAAKPHLALRLIGI